MQGHECEGSEGRGAELLCDKTETANTGGSRKVVERDEEAWYR